MPVFKFTDEEIANAHYYRANELEDKILNDEQDADLKRLYGFILSRMDRKTGIAGIGSHISRYALTELFNPKGNRGQKKQKQKGWEYIRWRLTKLEELGLIIKIGELVFKLPIATQDKHIQMRHTQSTHANHTPNNNNKTTINIEVLEIEEVEVHIGDSSKYTPPHKSYINKKDITNVISKKERLELPDWLSQEDWESFLEHRKSLKAPMSLIAQKRAITVLEKLRAKGFDVAEIINQSIINGWKGLFETKRTNHAAHNKSYQPSRADLFRQIQDEYRAGDERTIEGEYFAD